LIVECGHCGAPLDVRENVRVTKCRYCGVTNERQKLRTIAAETPADFKPPPVWHPPPHVAADSSVELKYRKKGNPGCVVVFLLLLIGGIGFGVYKMGKRVAFHPRDLANAKLEGTYKQFCAKQVAASEMENWCIIYLRTGGYDFVNVTWKPEFPDHASGFVVAIDRKNPPRETIKERFASIIPGGLDEHGSWRWPGINVNVGDDSSFSVTTEPDKAPKWKKQVDLLFKIFLYAAFDIGGAPDKVELKEVLGADYSLKDLLKIDPMTTIDKAEETVRKVFPAAALDMSSSGIEVHVGLDHPLLSQVELKWNNRKDAKLDGVSFRATKAYQAKRKDLVTCLTKKMGINPVVNETDYLKKKENYHFVIGKMYLYLPETYAYTGSDHDPASWKTMINGLDACRAP
jgi:hypothetical protein